MSKLKVKLLDVPEKKVLSECLLVCEKHPFIMWAHRMNTGAFKDNHGHYIRFGFIGLSDIIGQVATGGFFAWEVKRPGKKPSIEQLQFLETIVKGRGVAGWSDNSTVLLNFLDSISICGYPNKMIDGVFPNIK